MIKKTLYFGNPAYLSLANRQLVVQLPEVETSDVPEAFKAQARRTLAIEDIGVVVLDHSRITVTHGVLEALLNNNVALITCNAARMPAGLLLPLCGHSTQTEHVGAQLTASQPLKKQLWQQTVEAKIKNQAWLLEATCGTAATPLRQWGATVQSGDPLNHEAQAAAYYWPRLFAARPGFRRHREGAPPNALLNYGYAVLRAVVARALVAAGLLPSVGIFHHNKYNAYCLADDVMEPYRPVVDKLVVDLDAGGAACAAITPQQKQVLLTVPVQDVTINGKRRPLMLAAAQTAASLCKCFAGELRKVAYPETSV